MLSEFYKKVLKNGMTILFEKRNLPIVSIGYGVKVGGINESFDKKGISHFIEHMLYKGTPTRDSKKIAFDIEKKGGVLNGFTDETITGFWCKMPSEHWKVGLDVLTDLVSNPLFDEKEIEKERQVIFEEIKMRKDSPQIYVIDSIQSCLYKGTIEKNLIGDLKTMNSIDRAQLVERFEKTFVPENMVLCIVGDADFDEIVDFVEKNFKVKKSFVEKYKIELKNESREEFREGLDQAHLIFAYQVPTSENNKSYAAYILSAIMAEGMSSRLFSEIREKRNLAYAVKGGCEIKKEFAFNYIYVGTTAENVENVKKLILKEFEKVSKKIDEKEVEEVKQQIIGNYHLSFEDSQGQMLDLILSEMLSKAEDYYEFDKKIKKVNLKDVQEIASRVVDEKYSFFVLKPKK